METNTISAFLKKASEDEGLRKELVALAGRYGIALGSDELSEAALDQVAGGLLPAVNLSSPKLQTTLLSPGATLSFEGIKGTIGGRYKLGDGSV
ncbi:MAG: hypothetical protein IPJ48_21100 [Propionivibrio sp.]|uniref:Nif11 domain-containing protein n=1 Tax=Candidatus Propionivibrio dominans TaxID=2954373 RepID=A0A9D7IAN6_9RHOO|nr:hypothetical protein [Candidatus Propionivibrio dominans]MBL0167220.1 hypothetical protein [Propionivibrio sp.]